jgi:hypothetical protein
MAIRKQSTPASIRFGPAQPSDSGPPGQDLRPYLLLPVPNRKPPSSSRQYIALFPHESEDAKLTGSTRSLFRRLLGLNIPAASAPIEAKPELNLDIRPVRLTRSEIKIA